MRRKMVQKQMWHNTDPVLFTIFFTFGDNNVGFLKPLKNQNKRIMNWLSIFSKLL